MVADEGSSASRGAIPGISATERDVLLALRVAPRSSVKELAAAISLSNAGVRGPLARLEAAGLVTHDLAGEGPGRRHHAYRLTEVGMRLFPNRFEGIWREMARFLRERYPQVWDAFWEEETRKRLVSFPRYLEHPSPQGALLAFRKFYESHDFIVVTELTGDDEGAGNIVIHHCPYLGIAIENRMICELELEALSQALPGSSVERVAHQLDGDPHCQYAICFASAARSWQASGAGH